MASGFHTNELLKSVSNYPIAKGDVEGHAFHGNQFVSGDAAELVVRAKGLARVAGKVNPQQLAEAHREIAEAHRTIAGRLVLEANRKGGYSSEERSALRKLADEHELAADHHDWAAQQHEDGAGGDARAASEAVEATKAAAEASQRAYDTGR